MSPGSSEVRHYHERSRQFFFILSGEALMELDGEKILLKKNDGIEIPPGTPHKIINNSTDEIHFIVISSPKSHGDRIVPEE